MTAKTLIIGETNPYGADTRFALYPAPDGCSGHRLCCLIMGLQWAEYLRRFDRANLCAGKWSMKEAKIRAEELWNEAQDKDRPAIILLGRKVATAFAAHGIAPNQPFTVETNCTDTVVVTLPHPSGLCREWAKPGAYERAKSLLASAGIMEA